MSKLSYILLIQLLFIFHISGQDVEFSANAPGVVEAGQTFQITYTINVKPGELELPDITDFTILGGPSQGHSSSIQIMNGQMQQSSTYTYSYYLRAVNPGKFSISPAKAVYKKNEYRSNELTIEVAGGGQTQGTASAPQQSNQVSTRNENITSSEDIFIRLHVDKNNVYLNEPLTAYIKLYARVSVVELGQGFKGPDYTGFYRQDIEIPPLRSLTKENVNGVLYNTGVLQKVILYPQKTGEIVIEPFDLDVVTQKQVKGRSRSIFDDFFGTSVQNIPVKLKSKSVKINVKPLPASKPESYYGGVGSFTIKSDVNNTKIKTNDALTYKVTVSGKGNIRLLKDLTNNFPPGFEVYGPETKLSIADYSGSKDYEFTLIPRHAGEFKIPVVEFSYFDLNSKSYKTIKTAEYDIIVEKGDTDSTSIVVSNLSKEEIKLLGRDIKYIKQNILLKKNPTVLYGTRKLYMIYLLSFTLFIIILILQRGQIKRNADIVKVKNRKANKLAKRNLRTAKILLKQKDSEKFYEEVLKGMWKYLGYKLNIPLADLSKDKANIELNKYRIEKELISRFFEVVDNCELARYAPSGSNIEMESLYKNAYSIISKLDQKIR